ncbi:hypothetical protein CNMCM6069_007621 [Aspergillus lentulus]|nr:hypothetical protein CNMCM6069_007621 [Aspergillus lentulus]
MADSDEEYVGEVSDEENDINGIRYAGETAPVSRPKRRKQRGGAEWEVSRTWETLVEGADGTISSTVEGLLEAGKRKRLLRDTTPLQRGIIRHLILILDLSQSMAEKDLRPTRYLLSLRYAQEFVREFFEQNPISQLGVLGLRDGLAIRVSDMSGNPTEHISAIQALRDHDPKGLPSLQNGLEMARGALFHTPSHGTREVFVIFGSLLSSDPGDIHQTITTLINDKIRVRIAGLAAQVAICRELCSRTNAGDDTTYGVALNEQHFRDKEQISPPLDFKQLKTWLGSTPTAEPSPDAEIRNHDSQRASASETAIPPGVVPMNQQSPSIQEPAYPSSFARIVELITTGQQIPGIQQIPDTVLTGHDTPSEKPRRRKPWEVEYESARGSELPFEN